MNLVICIHPHLDGWIGSFVSPPTTKLHYLMDSKEDQGHHHDDENPHIWLSLSRVKNVINTITELVINLDPENKDSYLENKKSYLDQINLLHHEIITLFQQKQNKKFIRWHPAWNYFAKDYGLTIHGTIQRGHGHNPSVKQFNDLVSLAKQENIKIIVISLDMADKTIKTLVQEIHGLLLKLDTIGNPDIPDRSTYLKMIKFNATILAEAFTKQ